MLFTDISNARKFHEMFKDQLRWSQDMGGWMVYNGKVWERDRNQAIKRFSMDFYDALHEELQNFNADDVTVDRFSKHVKASGANGKLEAMLDCAKPLFSEKPESFDANFDLFNCQNGTLNLKTKKFGKMIEKETQQKRMQYFFPEDLLTKIAGTDFLVKSECPQWEKFLKDIFIGDQTVIDFMQRVVGYCMTASIIEQCLFILYGTGRNGKTIFLETIAAVLGDYAINCPPNTLIKKNYTGGIPNDVATLKGSRFVTAIESNQNVTLDEALIKQLTGGDKVTARFLHREFFDFHPTFKIFIATNHKPNIRGTDPGIWRRIWMIPFDLRITEETDDRFLREKLKDEFPGILIWAAKGYRKWLDFGLQPPQKVKDTTCNYKDEEDDLGQFMMDYCIPDPKHSIPTHEFKKKFKEIMGYAKSQKVISEYMERNGIPTCRQYVDGAQVKCWEGLKFPSIFEQKEDRHDYKDKEIFF